MNEINLNFNQYLELEKLGSGVFYPVKNFMTRNEFYSVVNNLRFKKKIFPLPIVLDVKDKFENLNFTNVIKLKLLKRFTVLKV